MKVIVGGIIEKEGKYLLVQEAKKKCYEKWNFPAGHLDFNESLEQGTIREIKEETGCDVKWFDYDEIVNKMESMLRGNYVRTAVINQNNNLVAPIDIVDILKD